MPKHNAITRFFFLAAAVSFLLLLLEVSLSVVVRCQGSTLR